MSSEWFVCLLGSRASVADIGWLRGLIESQGFRNVRWDDFLESDQSTSAFIDSDGSMIRVQSADLHQIAANEMERGRNVAMGVDVVSHCGSAGTVRFILSENESLSRIEITHRLLTTPGGENNDEIDRVIVAIADRLGASVVYFTWHLNEDLFNKHVVKEGHRWLLDPVDCFGDRDVLSTRVWERATGSFELVGGDFVPTGRRVGPFLELESAPAEHAADGHDREEAEAHVTMALDEMEGAAIRFKVSLSKRLSIDLISLLDYVRHARILDVTFDPDRHEISLPLLRRRSVPGASEGAVERRHAVFEIGGVTEFKHAREEAELAIGQEILNLSCASEEAISSGEPIAIDEDWIRVEFADLTLEIQVSRSAGGFIGLRDTEERS